MNLLEKQMVDKLIDLKENHNIIGVKAEFEAEGMRFDEALRLKDITAKAGLDLTIKIGGCEAIKDMFDARTIGVSAIVAPMIETPYAMKKYVKDNGIRGAKTDKLDSHLIATMLMSNNLPSYVPLSYHISELKSLTRHRFRLNQECTRFKISLSRLITIVFPELPDIVSSISSSSMLAMLSELPSAEEIANCNLKHLTTILLKNSHAKYGREKASFFVLYILIVNSPLFLSSNFNICMYPSVVSSYK